MPHEIEFEMIHNRRRSHRPVRVIRCDPTDRAHWVSHIYRSGSNLPIWSLLTPGWQWNNGGYLDPCARQGNHYESWAYLIVFRDGTDGVCRVADVNEALFELGARVDRRGDGAD